MGNGQDSSMDLHCLADTEASGVRSVCLLRLPRNIALLRDGLVHEYGVVETVLFRAKDGRRSAVDNSAYYVDWRSVQTADRNGLVPNKLRFRGADRGGWAIDRCVEVEKAGDRLCRRLSQV